MAVIVFNQVLIMKCVKIKCTLGEMRVFVSVKKKSSVAQSSHNCARGLTLNFEPTTTKQVKLL